MCVHKYTVCMPAAIRGQKRASEPLELGLERVASCPVELSLCPLGEQPVPLTTGPAF